MRCRPWLQQLLVGLPVLGLLGYAAAWGWEDWLGPRVRGYVDRQQARAEDARRQEQHRAAGGVLGELAAGRVHPGDPLREVTTQHPPTREFHFGPFTEAWYDFGQNTYVSLIARDDRLLEACWMREPVSRPNWGHRFVRDGFFEMTPADRTDWQAALRATALARRAAHMAVAGPLGYTGYHDPPR